MDMETQATIPLDFVIWAEIVAVAAWFFLTEQRKKYGALMSALIGGIALVACVFFATLFNADIIKRISISEIQEKIIVFLGWIAGGLLAAINAIIFNKRAAAQIKVAAEQAKNNHLTERGHIQDRFKAATEHLGHAHPGMRIGAYYEFYQLARENSGLRKIIFDMLCAHLRQITTASDYEGKKQAKPTEGVQTLLDLLFKSEDSKTIFRGLKANLQRTHLVGANLRVAHMPCTDFSDACLIAADMRYSQLHKCIFVRTKMHDTVLAGAQMVMSEIYEAKFIHSLLLGANLQMANMTDAEFYGAIVGRHFSSNDFIQMHNVMETFLPVGSRIARFGGADDEDKSEMHFVMNISNRVGKEGCIGKIVLSGDEDNMLGREIKETASFLRKYVDEESAQKYTKNMRKHVGVRSVFLRDKSGEKEAREWQYFDIAAYSEKQAKQWIAEYKEVMGETSGDEK